MGDSLSVIGNRTIPELVIPGTHDSGASMIRPDIEPTLLTSFLSRMGFSSTIVSWRKTQSVSILHQLYMGIRYLDLRIGWSTDRNEFWLAHSSLLSQPLEPVLVDIAEFLKRHPKEVVLINVQPAHQFEKSFGVPYLNLLFRECFRSVTGFYSSYQRRTMDTTINQLIDRNTRIMLLHPPQWIRSDDTWPSDIIKGDWINSSKLDYKRQITLQQIQQFVGDSSTPLDERMMSVANTATPQTSDIIKGLFSKPSDLEELTNPWNRSFTSFISNLPQIFRNSITLFTFDYVDMDTIRFCVGLNSIAQNDEYV